MGYPTESHTIHVHYYVRLIVNLASNWNEDVFRPCFNNKGLNLKQFDNYLKQHNLNTWSQNF